MRTGMTRPLGSDVVVLMDGRFDGKIVGFSYVKQLYDVKVPGEAKPRFGIPEECLYDADQR